LRNSWVYNGYIFNINFCKTFCKFKKIEMKILQRTEAFKKTIQLPTNNHQPTMNYNTQRLSQLVNNNINQRRRPVGKGTRETQYRNLIKTQTDDINLALKAIARHRVGQTYGEVWNLNVSKTALKKNKAPLQQLAAILARKSGGAPSIGVVADFITFVIMHHNIPVDVAAVAASALVVVKVTSDEGCGAAAAPMEEMPELEQTTPTPSMAVNDGDDDWETFADSFA